MEYSIFLDESGNTGEPSFKNNKWNFEGQPYFLLGAYSIKNKFIEKFKKDFEKILSKYDSNLGKTKELKSTAKDFYKVDLLEDMVELIEEYNVQVYIDISDKKYKIATYMVEYCIYPYCLYGSREEIREKCKLAADYIYNNLPEKIMGEYIDLCKLKDKSSDDLKEYLKKLNNYINDIELNKNIKLFIAHLETDNDLEINILYPIEDKTNKGASTSFLPNLDAYLNIVASKSKLIYSYCDNLDIYHDDQAQFSNCISEWTELMKVGFKMNNINNLEFKNSKQETLIQFIDYLTGNIRFCYSSIMKGSTKAFDRKVIKVLNPILKNCNVVTTNRQQKEFFDKIGVKNVNPTKLPLKI